jgi:cytochrome c oxidase cbb3-type subunit III
MSRIKIAVLLTALVLTATTTLPAQEPDAAAGAGGRGGGRGGRGGGRGGRGGLGGAAGTREFLGLGAAPDAAAAKKGEPLYQQNCSTCHGENARGAQGPNLVRSVSVLHDEKGEEIGPIVKSGRTGMPPFPSLSQDEIYNLSQYLKLQVELAANRGTYSQSYGDLRNKVTGDPKAGEAFFRTNCTGCHSASGDMAKIGSKFQQAAQLQQRFLWPATPGPAKVTVTTASGAKVPGTVSHEDDFTISIYDAAGEYHNWPRSKVKVETEDKMQGHRALLAKYSNADIHNMTAYLVTLK